MTIIILVKEYMLTIIILVKESMTSLVKEYIDLEEAYRILAFMFGYSGLDSLCIKVKFEGCRETRGSSPIRETI